MNKDILRIVFMAFMDDASRLITVSVFDEATTENRSRFWERLLSMAFLKRFLPTTELSSLLRKAERRLSTFLRE